jgi:hypothetical protein
MIALTVGMATASTVSDPRKTLERSGWRAS